MDLPVDQVGGEQLTGRAALERPTPAAGPGRVVVLDADVDHPVAQRPTDLVGQAGPAGLGDPGPDPGAVDRRRHGPQVVDGAGDRDEAATGGERHRADLGRETGLDRDHVHLFRLLFLTEVELEGRAAVVDGRGPGDDLGPVEVAEGHVGGGGREVDGRHCVLVDQVGGPFTPAEGAAGHEQVGGQHVDGVAAEAGAEGGDDGAESFGVGLGVLEGGVPHQVVGPHDRPLRHEGEEGDLHRGPVGGGEGDDTAVGRGSGLDGQGHPAEGEEGGDGIEAAAVVVVAGHDDDGSHPGQAQQGVVDEALGGGGRGGGVEQVAGHDDQIDVLGLGNGPDLGQDVAVLVGPAVTSDGLADMPVGGVEHLHRATAVMRSARRTGRRRASRPAPGRERSGGPRPNGWPTPGTGTRRAGARGVGAGRHTSTPA